jgi:hypothetical protein
MEDDGSALRVGAKYKSFTDLECALKQFQQDNYVQLYKRSQGSLVRGPNIKNMEVAESAACLLIYKEVDFSIKDLYFAPTRSALLSSTILKIISVGKCELYSEKYSYQ